ncbi:MAG: DUF927 domain-containing protein [Anaerotignaceae bacterium]
MEQLAYTKEDFLSTDKPYEDLYKFIEDKFTLNRMLVLYSDYAQRVCKITNFRTLFKAYCASQKKTTNNEIVGNITAFEGQELELDSGCWYCDEFGVSTALGQLGEVQACIHPIMPVQRLVNIDTNNEKLRIAYKKGGTWRHIISDKETLASNKIISLANAGIAVNSENAKYLIRYLHDIENINYYRIPEKKSIGRCGWIDGYGFSPYVEELIFDGEENFKEMFDSITQKGSFEQWKIAANEARGIMQARIVLAASFASVLATPLRSLPFFVHIYGGGSGTGKTVALMVATAVWANPASGAYWKTFNSTSVGQEMQAGFLNSLPLIIDELQLQNDNKKGFDKMIYELAEGVGRTRGSKGGGLQKTVIWKNTILTSGERPLAGISSGAGAVNRVIELNCIDTKLFKNGQITSGLVSDNYGHAGRKFVEWLEAEGNMDIAKKMFEVYIAEFKNTEITDKQIMAASLVLTADTLVSNIIFNDNNLLTVEQMSEFLKTKEDIDLGVRAYEHISQTVAMNKNRFDDSSENKGELWGKEDDKYYYIIRLQFAKICEAGGFSDASVLDWFKSKKMIEFAKGCTKSKKINGTTVACIWLKKQLSEEFEVVADNVEAPF